MGKDFQEKGSEGSRIGQRIKAKQWCGFRHGQASAWSREELWSTESPQSQSDLDTRGPAFWSPCHLLAVNSWGLCYHGAPFYKPKFVPSIPKSMCWSPDAPYLRKWLYLEIEPSKKKKDLFIYPKERESTCMCKHAWYRKLISEDTRWRWPSTSQGESSKWNQCGQHPNLGLLASSAVRRQISDV